MVTRRRQRADARGMEQEAPKKRERMQVLEQLSAVCGAMCAEIIYDSGDSRRFPLPRGAKKCIAKTKMNSRFQ